MSILPLLIRQKTCERVLTPRSAAVRTIITARPVGERPATARELRRLGVTWQELIMWPGSAAERDAALRDDPQAVATWKAQAYQHSGCRLYVESEPGLARAVARISQMPVLCPRAGRVFTKEPANAN